MRKIYKWGEFEELAKDTGLKFKPKERKVNSDKREAQRKKFLECKSCHGQRTYLAGTNCLICNCEVEREKEVPIKDKFGKVINKKKEIVKEPCGMVDLIAPEYQDYARYLFEDNERSKKTNEYTAEDTVQALKEISSRLRSYSKSM